MRMQTERDDKIRFSGLQTLEQRKARGEDGGEGQELMGRNVFSVRRMLGARNFRPGNVLMGRQHCGN